MLRYPTIAFDLDGTLTDSRPGILHSVQHALDELHMRMPDGVALDSLIGPPLHESMIRLGFAESDAARAVAAYRAHYAEVGVFENEPYAGISELLRELSGLGAHLAIATTKPDRFAHQVVDRFGWTDIFRDHVYCAQWEERTSRKDKRIADAIMGAPTPAAMVGDRSFDMQGARANDIVAIGVAYGYGGHQELWDTGADIVVDTVAELRDALIGGNHG